MDYDINQVKSKFFPMNPSKFNYLTLFYRLEFN